jgi:hypothetical protein
LNIDDLVCGRRRAAALSNANDDLSVAGINTPARICHFTARSLGFRTMSEYASGKAHQLERDCFRRSREVDSLSGANQIHHSGR